MHLEQSHASPSLPLNDASTANVPDEYAAPGARHPQDTLTDMNRKERRTSAKRVGEAHGASIAPKPTGEIEDVFAAAVAHYRNREFALAQKLCREILARNPEHVRALVLLGDMAQQGGRNNQAAKVLSKALALDPVDVTAHDNIGMAYQALGLRHEAVRHFTLALVLGLQHVETLVKQSTAVSAPLARLAGAWPRSLGLVELFGAAGVGPLAGEALLVAMLQSRAVCDLELERLFTAIRRGLLQHVCAGLPFEATADALAFYCALAEQCFLNEYVFAFDGAELTQLKTVQERIADALTTGAEIAPLDLIATAMYTPLHKLALAPSLVSRPWPDVIERMLTQQVREPLEEESDRKDIPALTSIDDGLSLRIQNQYEENPYPRWAVAPPVQPTALKDFLHDRIGVPSVTGPATADSIDILIAGCGTGSHPIDSAQRFPQSRVLAIDISRASLAYARRKTRALGLANIEYAQADILKLASIERYFDVIEAVGVLHHLSDPAAGWRILLSRLRPNGLMFVGLYSASARRSVSAARAFIAERGYRSTADDIRVCRQELIRRAQVPPFNDFSSTSGCRDLLFNVMEHQFTIPQIKLFLDANNLAFLGFGQLMPEVVRQFREEFPNPNALRDLGSWHAFEQAHPMTFGNMYFFWVQKCAPG